VAFGDEAPTAIYLKTLIQTDRLDAEESYELIRAVLYQSKLDLILEWIKENKLTLTDEIENMVREASPKLAICIQQSSNDPDKVIQAFVCTE